MCRKLKYADHQKTGFIEKRCHCTIVTYMPYMYIPEFPTLRGEAAIKALNEYIAELEEQKPVELTDKQVNAIIKFARELITSIRSETPKEPVQQKHSVHFQKVKDAVLLRLPWSK